MTSTTFVDRVSELQYLRTKVETPTSRGSVIFVAGSRGVGKSSITARFLATYKRIPGIKVPLLATGDSQRLDSGALIRLLAVSLNRLATTDPAIVNLRTFLREIPSKQIRQRYDDIVLREASGLPAIKYIQPLRRIYQRLTNQGLFDPDRLLTAGNEEVTYILFEYLLYALGKQQIVVNIENFHVADSESVELIRRLVERSTNAIFLLELTVNDEESMSLESLIDYFEAADVNVSLKRVSKLPFEAFLTLVSEHPQHLRTLLESAYYQHQGNLRSLIDLEVHLALEATKNRSISSNIGHDLGILLPDNPTESNIESLPETERFTLAAVVTHQSRVSRDLLRLLLRDPSFKDLLFDQDRSIQRLIDRELVITHDDQVLVSHDEVSKAVVQSPQMEKHRLLCYAAWARTYEQFLEQGNFDRISKRGALLRLFNLYPHFNPPALLGLLPEISRIVEDSLTPDTSHYYLTQLRDAFEALDKSSSAHEHVGMTLLDMYFSAGFFNEAMHLLGEMPQDSARVLLYRPVLLDRMDCHYEALEEVDRLKQLLATEPLMRLTLGLVEMVSERSLGNLGRARLVFEQLRDDIECNSLPEYTWLLRNAEIVVGLQESLAYLNQAIERFRVNGESVEEGRCRITLSMQLSRSGELLQARDELLRAEDLLTGRPLERHIWLNNRGANKLLGNRFEDAPASDFSSALSTALGSFERLVILYNGLNTFTMLGDQLNARTVARDLIELLDVAEQPDPTLHRSVFYNLSQAFHVLGEQEQAASYRQRAVESVPRHDPYWRHRLWGEPLTDKEWSFMARSAVHVGFLSRWHFTPPKSLERLRVP